jgi:hypothetical protein
MKTMVSCAVAGEGTLMVNNPLAFVVVVSTQLVPRCEMTSTFRAGYCSRGPQFEKLAKGAFASNLRVAVMLVVAPTLIPQLAPKDALMHGFAPHVALAQTPELLHCCAVVGPVHRVSPGMQAPVRMHEAPAPVDWHELPPWH